MFMSVLACRLDFGGASFRRHIMRGDILPIQFTHRRNVGRNVREYVCEGLRLCLGW